MRALPWLLRVSVLLSSVAGFSLTLLAQSAVSTPTLHVASDLVFLDVTVLDKKGKPVGAGLTKDDFTVTEDGKPQRILSFQAPDSTPQATATPAGESGPNAGERAVSTILVLDLLNTPAADFAYARDSIRRYLTRQPEQLASPTQLMVEGNTALNLIQPYTQSRDDLLQALRQIKPESAYKLGTMQFGSAVWFDQNLAQSIEALQQIALQNRGRSGKKNILWVGFGGPSIPVEAIDPRWNKEIRFFVHGTENMLVDARMSLFLIRPGSLGIETRNPRDANLARLDSSSKAGMGYGDPFKGTVNFGLFINGTGGQYFSNRNDTDRAIADAQQLGSEYYTLTYQPQGGSNDGRFREIKVTLRDPNLQAMTKSGYFAPELTTAGDSTPHHLDPMYEIEEAAHAGAVVDSLGLSLQHVVRHPDSGTVELSALLKSAHLRWQPTDDGRSSTDVTIAAVSLSSQRDVLASRLRRLTVFSDSQSPARLAASETPVTMIVPFPSKTATVRFIVLAQDGGETGTLELTHHVLADAPEAATPAPQLQPRPAPTAR